MMRADVGQRLLIIYFQMSTGVTKTFSKAMDQILTSEIGKSLFSAFVIEFKCLQRVLYLLDGQVVRALSDRLSDIDSSSDLVYAKCTF